MHRLMKTQIQNNGKYSIIGIYRISDCLPNGARTLRILILILHLSLELLQYADLNSSISRLLFPSRFHPNTNKEYLLFNDFKILIALASYITELVLNMAISTKDVTGHSFRHFYVLTYIYYRFLYAFSHYDSDSGS